MGALSGSVATLVATPGVATRCHGAPTGTAGSFRSCPAAAKGPTGPEDDTPGAEFTLTRDQFDRLRSVVPKQHLSIRLRHRGAAWAEVQMLDAEGAVIDS